ncbi:nuclear condensing complex subunit [Mycena amicta]|nr:nuclear condensing complex subunit [Mycena amicta]
MPDTLQASVAAIFEQAQTSLANHRKNCVALYKIHVNSAAKGSSKKRSAPGDQTAFVASFLDMVGRVLSAKKGPPTVERVIKFIAHYVRFVNEKGAIVQDDTTKQQPDGAAQSISSGGADEDDSLASVFVAAILEWIVQGFVAKNKVVRYQTVHLVAEMIMYLGQVEEDTYVSLRENLIERATCDKESTIRAQAVSALAHLIGSEDPSELQEGEKTILEIILEIVVFDPAADVRRAALLHLPLTSATLPAVLTRTRDVDPLLRKLVYASVLQPRLEHPRLLSIAQREQLVQTGLGDREPAVRLAAGKMVFAWFELVLADPARAEDALPWDGDDGGIMAALIAFLNLFDVVGPGEAIGVDAVSSLLTTRPDLFDVFTFSADYWTNLTPESAVLARVFLEHCLDGSREDRLEAASLPVVTAFAFSMQDAYNQLLAVLEDAEVARALAGEDPDAEMDDDTEEELAKREVIIGELLRMAVKLDYGDEIGRRKVYTVTRAMLAHPQLPPGLIARSLDVLKEILPSERELIRVVVEIIMDLREPEEADMEVSNTGDRADTTQSTIRRERSLRRAKMREVMGPEEAIRADMTDMRCLEVCISMLERVHGDFEDNSTLEGVLTDLVVPAVRRKEVGIREKGLVALGLCCLIAKGIAVKSLQLFLSQIQNSPEQLKFKLLKIVFDLMVMYDQQLWARAEDVCFSGHAIMTFLTNTLQAEDSPIVQTVLCIGLAKLLLSGLAEDPQTVKSLLLAYVSPYTAGNGELRQCLSYFFSVYCYSSAENQSRLQSIFMSAFDEVTKMNEELGEEQEHPVVSPQQFGLLVIDWTDARKAAENVATGKFPQKPHADLAVDILRALYDSDRRSEDQEVLCALLNKLNIEGALPAPLMVKLSVLVQHVQKQCPFDDAALDKAVTRFKNKFTTDYSAPLAEMEWAEWETPEMQELYDFIGIDVPEADTYVVQSCSLSFPSTERFVCFSRDARPDTPE